MNFKYVYFLFICLLPNFIAFGQQNYWQKPAVIDREFQKNRIIIPTIAQVYSLDLTMLTGVLSTAPEEFGSSNNSSFIQVPLPDRGLVRFNVVYSPVMDRKLATKYAGQIQTYKIYNPTNISEQGRIDITPQGFHGIIFTPQGTIYIDPYHPKTNKFYSIYFKHDYELPKNRHLEQEYLLENQIKTASTSHSTESFGGRLRIYRLALACTQEYAQFHGNTKVLVLGAMITSINRINSVYEKELSVRLRLVNLNDTLINLAPGPDPYSNNNGIAMLAQNQNTVDARIGSANYDIGHVYSTGGGGVAILGSVCQSAQKARGVTGSSQPINDPFDIDYVAHEIGHQFGANHTFNSTSGSCGGGNRNASTAYEPGSGTTIMAYAGICTPNNTQQFSNDYFHIKSLEEIVSNISNGPSSGCAQIINTTNLAPTAIVPTSYFIPTRTPFLLEGGGQDPNNDELSYCWEQYDLGASAPINLAATSGPLFRSFAPTRNPVRVVPQLPLVLSGTIAGFGEVLPTAGRPINFKLTVRDNSVLAGAYDSRQTSLNAVANTGPFVVRPSAQPTWVKGSWQRVNWQVAGTSLPPINCKFVSILYSRTGNISFADTLARAVPNTGAAMIWLPDTLPSLQTRIMVRARNNIFFNLSPAPITLTNPAQPRFSLHTLTDTLYMCTQSSAAYQLFVGRQAGFINPISLSETGLPAGLSLSGLQTFVGGSDSIPLTLNSQNITPGFYPISLIGQAAGQTEQVSFVVAIRPSPLAAPILMMPNQGATGVVLNPNFAWQPIPGFGYDFQISTDSGFGSLVYQQNNIVGSSVGLPIELQIFTKYFWRVRTSNICGVGSWSAVLSFQTLMPTPLGPFNAIAEAVSESQINLSWTDFANDETGFVVEMAAPLSGFLPVTTLPANTVFWAASALAENTIYQFRVRAYNQGGFSAYSNQVFDTTFVSTQTRKNMGFLGLNIIQTQESIEIGWQAQKSGSNHTTAYLYDALGRMASRQSSMATGTSEKIRIQTSRLASGVYMLCITNGLIRETKRILIR